MPNMNPSTLFNPMAFWTDVGLSALDTALSSTQNISDGVDRLTRVGARAEAADPAPAIRSAAHQGTDMPADFGLGLALRMQRTTLDLLGQAWQQWIGTLGTLASLGAGRSFRDAVERQNPWLNTLRESLAGEAEAAATRAGSPGSSRRQGGSSRERHVDDRVMEHAAATAEPKRPRRGGRVKSKAGTRSRSSSRRER